MDIIYLLEKNYNVMSSTEKIIANFIINNRNTILNANIHKTAEELNISPSSISRFVRKYFDLSFAELKIKLASTAEIESIHNSEEMIRWADSFDTMPSNIISNIDRVCEDIININGIDAFKSAIELINNANVVYIFGSGVSGIIAQDFQYKLMRLNKTCVFSIDARINLLNSAITTSNDIAIAISFSGDTPETNIAVEQAKKNGTKCITVTRNAKTKLESLGDLNILVPSCELNSTRLASIFSRYGQLFIFDMLFLGLVKKTGASLEDFMDFYNHIIRKLKTQD